MGGVKTMAACALMMGPSLLAEVPTVQFLDALAWHESARDDRAVGDKGKAWGRYQIWQCVLDDVNRIYGASYTKDDCFDAAKATAICRMYLSHWGEYYQRQTGNPATVEVLARIWNGGPEGWRKRATDRYWILLREKLYSLRSLEAKG